MNVKPEDIAFFHRMVAIQKKWLSDDLDEYFKILLEEVQIFPVRHNRIDREFLHDLIMDGMLRHLQTRIDQEKEHIAGKRSWMSQINEILNPDEDEE